MRFNLQTSKLLYEVRHQSLTNLEDYTYQQLYENINGDYFIHFERGKCSKDLININCIDSMARKDNYYVDGNDVEIWRHISKQMKEEYPKEFLIIDWQKEERENLIWMGRISEEDLPF